MSRVRKVNTPTLCSKCGETFPFSAEYFKTDKKTTHGISQPCKNCANLAAKAWNNAHKEEHVARTKAWRNTHKEECAAYERVYREAHKEEAAATWKAWYNVHAEERAATGKAYKEAHKEEAAATGSAWKKANPIQCRLQNHRRRIKIKEAGGSCTQADIDLQYKNQKGRCWWCKTSLKKGYHIDHRIPIAKGGPHDPKNIVLACSQCNGSKGTKLPQEWVGRLL